LRVYDVSNPSNPINVGHTHHSANLNANFQDVAVLGHFVFLANAADGLRIYDVADASNPINIGHTNNSTALRAYASSVAVCSNLV